jgi:hypothetical protein
MTATLPRYAWAVSAERFLNSYHNASTPPGPDVPAGQALGVTEQLPLVGFDGQNDGFIQASDRLEGEFTEQDEANLVRLATLTSAARDGLAQLHLPNYQNKVGT